MVQVSWTTFPTLVDGQIWTGAHTQIVRDNFAETAPAKATTAGQIFVATGANTIVARFPDWGTVGTTETTGNLTYTDLATVGPSVTLNTGARMLVFFGCQLMNNTNQVSSYMSYTGAGQTASDSFALQHRGQANDQVQAIYSHFVATATPGSNTLTAKYHVGVASTGTFQDRRLQVLPLS